MAFPSYTYTLTNGTTANASEVMQNFNDILNGLSDGTKDANVNALTAAGTATFNGNVALGNATSDTVTFTARVASGINPSTTQTYALGTSALGWAAINLDNGATDGGAIYFDAGTTAFLKSDASHADLDISGFTDIDFNSTRLKGLTSITSDCKPTTADAYDLGTSSLPWRALYLDHGSTDAGAIYFNAGTSNYIKSNAAGTELDIQGFQVIQYLDTTSAGTTDLQIISNNTNGTSKLSIGHNTDPDAAYMKYNVSAGTISWGTNGSTDTMILSIGSELKVGNGSASLPAHSFTGDPDTGMYNAGANQIGFASGGTRRLTIDSNGLLFQNGSVALNYYDEGTWTPGVTINGVAQTLGVNTARYVRVGRSVFCTFEIEFSKTADVGNVIFTGLPFTSGSVNYGTISLALASGIVFAASQVAGYVSPSGTTWIMTNIDAAGGARTNWTNTQLGAATVLYGSVSYRA